MNLIVRGFYLSSEHVCLLTGRSMVWTALHWTGYRCLCRLFVNNWWSLNMLTGRFLLGASCVACFLLLQGWTSKDFERHPQGVRQGHDSQRPRKASSSSWGKSSKRFALGADRPVLAGGRANWPHRRCEDGPRHQTTAVSRVPKLFRAECWTHVSTVVRIIRTVVWRSWHIDVISWFITFGFASKLSKLIHFVMMVYMY